MNRILNKLLINTQSKPTKLNEYQVTQKENMSIKPVINNLEAP